jgi:hypothetical protein
MIIIAPCPKGPSFIDTQVKGQVRRQRADVNSGARAQDEGPVARITAPARTVTMAPRSTSRDLIRSYPGVPGRDICPHDSATLPAGTQCIQVSTVRSNWLFAAMGTARLPHSRLVDSAITEVSRPSSGTRYVGLSVNDHETNLRLMFISPFSPKCRSSHAILLPG